MTYPTKKLGKQNNYFPSKLFDINNRISIHEGNANRRLASEAARIMYQLGPHQDELPDKYKEPFNELISLLKSTIKSLPQEGLTPTRIKGIQNITAAKYIKILLDIQSNYN